MKRSRTDYQSHLIDLTTEVEPRNAKSHSVGRTSIEVEPKSIYIPEDVLLQIIYHLKYPLPWQLIHFIELQLKNVNKSWQLTIQNNVTNIRNFFGIGLLHYMASMNRADEIMRLNMEENYSLREADKLGYSPASYAVGSCAYNSAVRLKIAHALNTRHVTGQQLYSIFPVNSKNIIAWKLLIENNAQSTQPSNPVVFGGIAQPINPFAFATQPVRNTFFPTMGIINSAHSDSFGLTFNDTEEMILNNLKKGETFFEGIIFKTFLRMHDDNLLTVSYYSKLMMYAYKNWLVYAYWETLHDNKYINLVKLCTKYEINFNSCDETGMTFLHVSTNDIKSFPYLKFLLQQKNINVNYISKKYGSALRLAILRNNIDAINLLLANGANPYLIFEYYINNTKYAQPSPIIDIINGNKSKLLEIIIEHDLQYGYKNILQYRDADKKTLIQYAIRINSIECVKLLLKVFDVNSRNDAGISLIDESILSKNIECVKLLIESGAKLTMRNNSNMIPSHVAIISDFPECLEILLKHTKEYRTGLLFYSILLNRTQCLRILIDSGIDINIKNNFNVDSIITPLMYSVYINNIECTKILLESKADINMIGDMVVQKIIKNTYRHEIKYFHCTALHIATHYRYASIINLLDKYNPNKSLLTKYQISIQNDENPQPFISTTELSAKDIYMSKYLYSGLKFV